MPVRIHITQGIKHVIIFKIINPIVSKLRDRMEFSRNALRTFDFLEKQLPPLLEIGFGCNAQNTIEIVFDAKYEHTLRDSLKKIDGQKNITSSEIICYSDDEIMLVTHLSAPLKNANNFTITLINRYDQWFLNNSHKGY